jgi:hypothetical protein
VPVGPLAGSGFEGAPLRYGGAKTSPGAAGDPVILFAPNRRMYPDAHPANGNQHIREAA